MTTTFLITVAVAFALYAAYRTGHHIANLQAERRELYRRIRELEDAQAVRMSYRAINGIEDATAVALDLERYAQSLKLRNEQLLTVLRTLRSDGANYDPDRPAGRRPGPVE